MDEVTNLSDLSEDELIKLLSLVRGQGLMYGVAIGAGLVFAGVVFKSAVDLHAYKQRYNFHESIKP